MRSLRVGILSPLFGGSLFCLLALSAHAAPVKVWQDTLTLPTYAEEPPEISPAFELLPVKSYIAYPYTVRDQFAADSAPQTWRQLNLENEFLFCRFLPDLGGRIYGCRDKVSGQEMFYANSVVKKTRYGTRGAFAAIGVEPGFPIARSPQSIAPVDFALTQNGDGSGSVWVASTTRDTGLRWRIEYRLRAGSTVLEETVYLYNGGAAAQRYQWWNIAAVGADDPGVRVIFPTRATLKRNPREVDSWPMADGTDLSVIANHKSSAELYALNSREPFVAVYHPGTRSGMAHYADATVLTGKQLRVWGSQDGRKARKEFSDDNSISLELQTGLFPTWDRYELLGPQQTRLFYEYWMPARNLDGISRANLHAVVYLGRIETAGDKTSARIEINANHAIPGATIRLSSGSRQVFETKTDLEPAGTFSQTVENLPAGASYTLELFDRGGQKLLTHTENRYETGEPPPDAGRTVKAAKPQNEQEYAAEAMASEMEGKYYEAHETYAAGLKQFPGSRLLRKQAGRLSVALNRFAEAAALLSPAAASAPADPEITYYWGAALAGTGDDQKARVAWETIRADAGFGPAASFELGCLLARAKDFPAAARLLQEIGEAPQSSRVRAGAALVAVLRHAGQKEAAQHQLGLWLAADPASLLLRFEKAVQSSAGEEFWAHLAADPERVLEIADHYMHLGLYDDALRVLDHVYPAVPPAQAEPGAVLPQEHALVVYYRGYCRQRLGQPAHPDFEAASKLSTRYVFPARASASAVLEAAVRDNPSDASAHLLLGDLYMSRDLAAEAVAEWQKARALRPSLETLHRNLARALLEVEHNPADGLEALRDAAKFDPAAPDILDGLSNALSAFASAITPDDPPPGPPDSKKIAQRALAVAAQGRGSEAMGLFRVENFPDER
ncbi:MAG TPA: DUF5107 domain-containing protein, partial [Bryobacteraceae bacterium]|nr:DUF5107 domain-containing protein [Bryobacteraceae bacterium]